MEDSNIHTSVVIELANSKEESEEQNSYQIEIDDMNMPKDYVIDQIFCGENVTVYALFEVPEGENRNLDKNYMKVNNSNKTNDSAFDYKKVVNEKKLNGFKKNTSPKSSEEYLKFFSETKSKNKSLYCLKHPSGNYDLLTPNRKKSDLRVLYSKNFAFEETKSTKFKAISVGVNTDIVQCPRILEEVQKVLGVNVPLLKFREKMIDTPNYSPTPSSNTTEVETRQSVSSLVSAADSRVSNLFFVPLLMMEDDSLSKYSKDDSTQKSIEKDSRNLVLKVSLGINTDDSEFDSNAEMYTKRKQNTQIVLRENSKDVSLCSSDQNLDEKLKLNEKRTILKEIKTMQSKLSALIEKIESSNFESDEENYDLTESASKICNITTEGDENKKKDQQNILEPWEKNKKNFDERPILSTWNYLNKDHKPPINLTQAKRVEEKNETHTKVIDSVFNGDLSNEELHPPEIKKVNEQPEAKKTASYCKIRRKSSGSSKSETNLFSSTKYDTLKNSLSLDFKNVKSEAFKNIKNNLFVSVENLKRNVKGKILQDNEIYAKNNENLTDSELGDDFKKKLRAKINIINSIQENKIEESFCEIDSDVKKNHKVEEGDAKFPKPEKIQLPMIFVKGDEKPQTAYLDSNFIPTDGLLSPKRSLLSCRKESKSPDKTTEVEKKTCSDSEKPATPNVNVRKIITTHSNMKKDFKVTKKAISRYKVAEATAKVDIPYKRILSCCRAPNKVNGESKLHINKLIKAQGVNNNKISNFTRSNNDEKVAAKGDRICRPSSQKLENKGNPPEVLNGSNKEAENKCLKVHVDTPTKKIFSSRTKVESVTGLENIEESPSPLSSQKQIPLTSEASSDSSSVVVKLLSKKPESIKDICSELSEEFPKSKNVQGETNEAPNHGTVRNNRTGVETDTNIEKVDKSIVKSVWALTKVLLFEDGTKKLEVLEASLTPPGYSLNHPVKTPK